MTSSRIVTIPVPDSGSSQSPVSLSSWEKISASPASVAPSSKSKSPSSDGSSDLAYWFRLMSLPNHQGWAHKFHNAGYEDMDEVSAADLDAVFNELKVPSGVQNKLRGGIQQFQSGTLGENSMPPGDLDATAPVQTKGFDWWFWGGVAATVVASAAAGGAIVVAVQASAEAAAAAAAAQAAKAAAAEAAKAAAKAAAATATTSWVAGILTALGDCLDGETLVTMADRSKKKIKDVKIGDKILSYNKGKLRVKTVVEVKEGSSKTMRELFLQAPDGKAFSIKATGGHPFFTKENQWAVTSPDDAKFDSSKPVKKLAVGDMLVLRSGAGAKLVKIGEQLPTQKTYNLAIDGPGTFFVEGILSHSGLPQPKK